MAPLTMKELLESGAHFGHQTKRWNPKMKRYIYGSRNGIYIIDLQKTLKKFLEAYNFVRDVAARGESVLFVGTKKQAQEIIVEQALRCQQFFVNARWLGGTLTNFRTIHSSIQRLRDLDAKHADGSFDVLTKKEALGLEKDRQKLEKFIGGIKQMDRLPSAVFIIDSRKERIAVNEARKLRIPSIAMVDTNCDPDDIDFVIPSNDDAIRSIRLITTKIAEAVIEGQNLSGAAPVEAPAAMEQPAPTAVAMVEPIGDGGIERSESTEAPAE